MSWCSHCRSNTKHKNEELVFDTTYMVECEVCGNLNLTRKDDSPKSSTTKAG